LNPKNKRWTPRLLICALVFAGCATVAEGPSGSEARIAEPNEGQALVYVFRSHAEPLAWGASVFINDRKVATLRQRTFTSVYVTPGPQTVKAKWPMLSGQLDAVLTFDAVERQTYYVELVGITRLKDLSLKDPTHWVMTFAVGSGLVGWRAEAAKPQIDRCCRYQKAESSH
jgi:hypothetical protein